MIQFVNRYFKRYRRELAAALLFSVINSAMTAACSQLLKNVIRGTLENQGASILRELVTLLCLAAAWVTSVYFSHLFSGRLGIHMAQGLKQDVIEKVMDMRYDCFMSQDRGSFLNRLNDDIADAAACFDKILFSVLLNGITIVVISCYLLTVDWKLLLLSMVWIPLITLLLRHFMQSIAGLSREKKIYQDRLISIIQESFESCETEKSYHLQERNLDAAGTVIDQILEVDLKQQKREAFFTPVNLVIQSLPALSCCVFAAIMAYNGKLAVENFISFLVLLSFIAQPISNFTSVLVELRKAGVGVERLAALLQSPAERMGGERVKQPQGKPVISFQNVSFSYRDSGQILKDITFSVKSGERVAFVGNSGSGKTTFLNLLLGLYEPGAGEYRLFDIPFSSLDLEEARRYFSIVSQETFVFPDTIAENLRYGKQNASEEELRQVMKAVSLDCVVMSLPERYQTVLGEGGANLSGGQKQRLAIARALLRNSEIILFDEPTSALDGKSESEIMELIDTVLAGRTIITIAHRLNTIVEYDRIYMLDHGTIAEMGSHEELIAERGLYFKLYEGREAEV